MSDKTKKWLLWGSIILLIISVCGITYAAFAPFTEKIDFFQSLNVAVIIAMILNFLFIPVFKYKDRTGFRKWMRMFTLCFPVMIIILFIIEARWFPQVPYAFLIIYLVLVFIFMGIACLYLFVIDDRKASISIILILAYILITLGLRRIDTVLYESHYYVSFLMIGCGMYLFGLRSFFSIKRNRYLQIMSLTASLLIYLGSITMFYLSMTSRFNTPMIIYSILLFLLTLIVLFSLPVSGYVEWSASHKSILKKILIPWVFFLLLISIRIVFPDLNLLLFRQAREQTQEFQLDDYPVINKNGLEPE